MLPDAVVQGMGWQPSPGAPALPSADSDGNVPQLHPAVLQALGAGPPAPTPVATPAPPAPAPMDAAPDVADPGAPPAGSANPEPPPGIGGPGATLPSMANQPAAPAPGESPIASPRDFKAASPAPQAPAQAPAPAVKPAPARPMSVEQQMAQNQAQVARATQEEKAASAAQTEAQLGQAHEAFAAQQDFAAKEKELQAQAQAQREEALKEHAAAQQVVADRMKALDNYKIDQGQYWNSMGIGDHIGWYVGIALSQIGNALMGKGGENPVMQMLQDKMKQSIVMQQDQRDQMEKGVGRAKEMMQEGDLYQAKRAADIAQAEADATKMLKIQVDLATAKAADPTIRANGMAESAKLDRQLAQDMQTATDKLADYQIKKQQNAIAGGHLALAGQQFQETRRHNLVQEGFELYKQNQEDLLKAAALDAKRQGKLTDEESKHALFIPGPDGKPIVARKANGDPVISPEAGKDRATLIATATYSTIAKQMADGIKEHGGESDWFKSADWQKMQSLYNSALVELHKAYDVPSFRGEWTADMFKKIESGGVNPTSFLYDAIPGLEQSANTLVLKANEMLKGHGYAGPPIAWQPVNAPDAASPDQELIKRLQDNRELSGFGAQAAVKLPPQVAARLIPGMQAKLDEVSALKQRAEDRDASAITLLGKISTDGAIAAPVRAAASAAMSDLAAQKEAKRAKGVTGPFVARQLTPSEAAAQSAESHIPDIVRRINPGMNLPDESVMDMRPTP